MRSLGERLLIPSVGRQRAAAIYGDLLELAQTRGRGYFRAAYLRALVALAWRPAAAFLFGYVSFLIAAVLFQQPWVGPGAGPQSPLAAMLQHGVAPLLPFAIARLVFPIAGPLLASITIPLRFVFPYAAFRYGLRDRMVQLAGAAYVATNLVLLYPPLLSPLLAVAVVLGFATALMLAPWRRPTIALATSLAAGICALAGIFGIYTLGATYLLEQLPHPGILYKAQMPSATLSLVALFVAALVCSWLHRRLLRSPYSGVPHAEPA
jgi:hypothetical protein